MARILSISGGGYLGLLPAALLARMETVSGAPIGRHFDLLSGTSIGGVIALGLAADLPAAAIVTGIIKHGPAVFPAQKQGLWSLTAIMRLLRRSRHDSMGLRRAIGSMIDPAMTMRELRRDVLVPLIRLADGFPVMVGRRTHPDWRVVDVAMAAAAAPMIFPAVSIGGALHCDGAPFANSPDLLAMHEATRHLGLDEAAIRVVSLGTMTARFDLPDPDSGDMGLMGWLRNERILKTFLSTQQVMAEAIMRDWIGERYLRIDCTQGADQAVLGLDVASMEATRVLMARSRKLHAQHRGALLAILDDVPDAVMLLDNAL